MLAFRLQEKWSKFIGLIAPGGREKLQRHQRVVVTDLDFTLLDERDPETHDTVSWNEVAEIQTYKYDLWSTDEICLAFTIDGKSWTEISEEVQGFGELCRAMSEHFPTIKENWFREVMLPAFATNHRMLYKVGGFVEGGQTTTTLEGTTTWVDF